MTPDTTERLWPDIAIPTGELLGEELEVRGVSQQELARRMGRPPQMVNERIHGKKALTPETALGLEKVLGIPASFWTNSESSYQLTKSRIEEREQLEREAETWLHEFPVAEMVRRQVLAVQPRAKPWEKAHALLQFLGFSSFGQWEAQTATAAGLRVTDSKRASRGALAVWLREGELDGYEQEAEPYSEARFRKALQALRHFTTSDPDLFSTQMHRRCAAAGIVVSFVKEYPKANATGAARWLQPDKGQIQLSLRHKTADMLWFSFYHEAEHLLGRHFKGARVDGMKGIEQNAEEEAICDAFARDTLIPGDAWEAFTYKECFSERDVREFAEESGIHPGIVVGRLQHEHFIPHHSLNHLKTRLVWSD